MNRGFTLIEILVALALMALATLGLARLLGFSLQVQRQAELRFQVGQRADAHKGYLLSLPFAAAALGAGRHELSRGGMRLYWEVRAAEVGLKRIALTVQRGGVRRSRLFYKSDSIKEVTP